VLNGPDFEMPKLAFPLIVKPKNEAVSFGIRIVNNEQELRDGSAAIFKEFAQPVLVERFIAGREINVGLLGNNPPEALPPAELCFGKTGPQIYTYEDKTRKSGREIIIECPAPISPELTAKAQDLARRAFSVLGCYDCARVDMRLDDQNNLYILEVNSLPSMGEHGSYVQGAAKAGLDFTALVNRLVEVASARYFGTPSPPAITPSRDGSEKVFGYLTSQRDDIERQVQHWTTIRSRTADIVGMQAAQKELDEHLCEMGMKGVPHLTDSRVAWTWESAAGLAGGTLLVGHLDVPLETEVPAQMFHRDPEWLYGEGIGASRAPLVAMLFAMRALRAARQLRHVPLGVLYYCDEGRDCRYSAETITKAAALAKNVLVLRPGNVSDRVVTMRRGQRRYRLLAEGVALRLGQQTRKPEVLRWMFKKLEDCAKLTSRKDRIAVSTIDLQTTHMPMLLPHQVAATLLVSYPDESIGDEVEQKIRGVLDGKEMRWKLESISTRPPMQERRANSHLLKAIEAVAAKWEIPLSRESSVWPSVAGLVPASTGVLCGMGPVARNLYTPEESVQRISLVQRTLLLAEFLSQQRAQAGRASSKKRVPAT
jgi:D-alanine-D-alanine ligase